MSSGFELDERTRLELVAKFHALSTQQMKKAHRIALSRSGKILADKAKYYIRSVTPAANHQNWWNGKSLQSGIKVSVSRDVDYATIHILGDFRLKFFQDGTKSRKTEGHKTAGMRRNRLKTKRRVPSGKNRGKIKATGFYAKAEDSVRGNMLSTLNKCLDESIKKVWEQG